MTPLKNTRTQNSHSTEISEIKDKWQLRSYMLLSLSQFVFIPLFSTFNLQAQALRLLMILIFILVISLLRKRYSQFIRPSLTIIRLFSIIIILRFRTFPIFQEFLGYILINLSVIPLNSLFVNKSKRSFIILSILSFIIIRLYIKEGLILTCQNLNPMEFPQYLTNQLSIIFFELALTYFTLGKINHEVEECLTNKTFETENLYQRMKSFIHEFSHEIRNPLNNLIGFLDLALIEREALKIIEDIRTSKLSADYLLQLVNSILDLEKAELGKLEIIPIEVNSVHLFKKIWNLNNYLISSKEIKGLISIAYNMPMYLTADPLRISQILNNLIGNSVKFTEKGFIKLSIKWIENSSINSLFNPVPYTEDNEVDKVFEKDENVDRLSSLGFFGNSHLRPGPVKEFKVTHGFLKIIVRDTGDGMDDQSLGKLFERFSQFGLKKNQFGTGLGMGICKEICEKMGGMIRVYSKKNIGTTVILAIPLAGRC